MSVELWVTTEMLPKGPSRKASDEGVACKVILQAERCARGWRVESEVEAVAGCCCETNEGVRSWLLSQCGRRSGERRDCAAGADWMSTARLGGSLTSTLCSSLSLASLQTNVEEEGGRYKEQRQTIVTRRAGREPKLR